MLRIEPVRPPDRDRAVSVLLGRAAPPQQIESVLAMLTGPEAGQCRLWWARSFRGPRVAAMSTTSPGATAAMFNSRPRGGRDVAILARLLSELTAVTMRGGARYAQALLPPDQRHAADAYLRAGYEYITQLVYLRRSVHAPAPPPQTALTWTDVTDAGDEAIKRLIEDTYIDSRDCPDLLGLRDMDDVLAGHRSSGVYRPDGWFLPRMGDEYVGCVLANDAGTYSREVDVVYLGVRPAWRHRGLARAMIHHVAAWAADRGRESVTLACDVANLPALNLYHDEGFVETSRRDVYAMRVR